MTQYQACTDQNEMIRQCYEILEKQVNVECLNDFSVDPLDVFNTCMVSRKRKVMYASL